MNWLICGTRKKMNCYEELVKQELTNCVCCYEKNKSYCGEDMNGKRI